MYGIGYFLGDAVGGALFVICACCAIGYLLGGICCFIHVGKSGPKAIGAGSIYGLAAMTASGIGWGSLWIMEWFHGPGPGAFSGGIIGLLASWKAIPALICAGIEQVRPELSSSTQTAEFILSHEKEIYLSRDGQSVGPFDEITLRMWIVEGKVDANEWAWKEGNADWLPLIVLLGNLSKEKLATASS